MTEKYYEDWYSWRKSKLLQCSNPQWNPMYDFFADILQNINDYPKNYSIEITSDVIDFRVTLYLYKLFSKASFVNDTLHIDNTEYKKIIKTTKPGYSKKLHLETGLTKFGFLYNKSEQSTEISFSKNQGVLGLLYVFAKKCSINKSNGFYSFLICNLCELEKKTSIDFDFYISRLSIETQSEIVSIDKYLLGLKPIKFKRQITFNWEKGAFLNMCGEIKYISEAGFCYTIKIESDKVTHNAWWTIMPNYNGVRWCRKNDFTVDVLNQVSSEKAIELWTKLKPCRGTACKYGSYCVGRTTYEFSDKKVVFCHGRMIFDDTPNDFGLVRVLVNGLNKILRSTTV